MLDDAAGWSSPCCCWPLLNWLTPFSHLSWTGNRSGKRTLTFEELNEGRFLSCVCLLLLLLTFWFGVNVFWIFLHKYGKNITWQPCFSTVRCETSKWKFTFMNLSEALDKCFLAGSWEMRVTRRHELFNLKSWQMPRLFEEQFLEWRLFYPVADKEGVWTLR